ncbi:MAG: hypothetical protein ABI360_00920 [Allobranchiibius sp.]
MHGISYPAVLSQLPVVPSFRTIPDPPNEVAIGPARSEGAIFFFQQRQQLPRQQSFEITTSCVDVLLGEAGLMQLPNSVSYAFGQLSVTANDVLRGTVGRVVDHQGPHFGVPSARRVRDILRRARVCTRKILNIVVSGSPLDRSR